MCVFIIPICTIIHFSIIHYSTNALLMLHSKKLQQLYCFLFWLRNVGKIPIKEDQMIEEAVSSFDDGWKQELPIYR